MFHIALYQPEIPPNTGNIIRLCANTSSALHLIHPLGFQIDDKRLRRAGMDYYQQANITQHLSFSDFLAHSKTKRLLAFSTHGRQRYDLISYQADDVLLFGPETRGLPKELMANLPAQHVLRIPMVANSRSLNLSNAVAIVLYEAWRQVQFSGCH